MSEQFFINKYGEEEGKRKWKEYCDRQAYTCSYEYFKEKFNMSEEEFNKYNKSRAITKESMINKYGEDEGNKRWKEYCKKQSYTNSEKYFIEKYGEEDGKRKYLEINFLKSHTLDSYIKKYGQMEGSERYNNYIKTIQKIRSKEQYKNYIECKHNSFAYSKISQDLFLELDSIYSKKYKNIYYGIKEDVGEFSIHDDEKNKQYYYDFVIEDIKFCIEFNGDYWHCNPNIYKPSDIVKIGGKEIKVIDIWEKDNYKINKLKELGYNVIIIWEKDYRKNPDDILLRIEKEINKYDNRNNR